MKLKVETWGLCDFRKIGDLAEGHELQGIPLKIGQWINAQDGSVYGPFDSKEEAEKFTGDYWPDTCAMDGRPHRRDEEGRGPVYIGKITEILHKRDRNVSLVEIETEA
jgi:hypothetical protein